MSVARLTIALLVVLASGPLPAAEPNADSVTESPVSGLAPIDWAIIAVYAMSTLGLGWYYSRRQRTTQEYFVGGGKMNPILVGVSLFATLLSTISYLSMPGESLGKGPVYMTTMLAYPLVFLIVGYGLLPVYMRHRVTSAYELLEMRLGLSVRLLGAGMFITLRLVWMSLLVYLTAKAMTIMLGVTEDWIPYIVLVTGFVAVVYTSLGGLQAVVVTDFIQTLLLYGGALLVLGVVTYDLGGLGWFPTEWQKHWDTQPIYSFDPATRVTVVGSVLTFLVWYICTSGGDQTSVQRFMAVEDVRAARRAYATQLVVAVIVGVTLGMVGFALLGLFPSPPGTASRRNDAAGRCGPNLSAVHRVPSAARRVGFGGRRHVRSGDVEHRLRREFDYGSRDARLAGPLRTLASERASTCTGGTTAGLWNRCRSRRRQFVDGTHPRQHHRRDEQDGEFAYHADLLSVFFRAVCAVREAAGRMVRGLVRDCDRVGHCFLRTTGDVDGEPFRCRPGAVQCGVGSRDQHRARPDQFSVDCPGRRRCEYRGRDDRFAAAAGLVDDGAPRRMGRFMNLSGRVALVTGAGRGIGKGCAVALANSGAELVINDRPGSPDLEQTAEDIRSRGRRCHAFEADAFTREGCEGLLSKAVEAGGRIDILISNPAYSWRCAFLEYPGEEFERTIAGTLTSGFHMSQLAARQMVEQGGGGKIVFISSVQAEMPIAMSVAYGAAKAGLNHMMRTIAVELSAHRINVNAIEPGWIDTPGEHVAFSEEVINEEGRRLPWGRLGTPADIGNAAAFLCSDEADYITGAVLPVDGCFRFKDCRSEQIIPANSPQSER